MDRYSVYSTYTQLALSTELDLDSQSYSVNPTLGEGAFGGIMLKGTPLSYGSGSGFHSGFNFDVGLGLAAGISAAWGSNGFQFSTSIGYGFGMKYHHINFGYTDKF